MSLYKNTVGWISNIISPEVPPENPKSEKKVNPKPRLLQYKINNRIKNSIDDIGCRNASDGWNDNIVYDFEEIRRAEDKESFLAISFRKHIEMIVKRGWTIRGKNQDFIRHVRERLWEMFILSGVSTKSIVRGIVKDLVRFSNGYIVFKRSDQFPIKGRPYRWRGKRLKPIVGMFRADPSNMKPVFRTRSGRKKLVAWKHSRDDDSFSAKSQTFKKEDVMHIKWTDKGLLIGTPYAIPVLDDIRALRRIEEFIEMICAKHAFPLIHYKVGTENEPAEIYEDGSGRTEVDDVREVVEQMPTEGCWVTSERHSLSAVDGVEGVDLEKYLKHFEDRVISGCGISGISLGRASSANRSTASVIDKILIDRASDIQDIIADAIDTNLILHLHLDSGKPFGPDDMAHFKFFSPDTEEERSQENHYLNQYQSSAITETELREEIHRPPLTKKSRKDMYAEKTNVYTQRRYAEMAKEFGYTHSFPGVKSPSSSGSGPDKSANKTKSKTKPTNQYGTKSTKTKVTVNGIKSEIRSLKHCFVNLDKENYSINIPMAKSFILNGFENIINHFKQRIYADMCDIATKTKDSSVRSKISDCVNKVKENSLKNIYDSCIIKLCKDDVDILTMLDTTENELIKLLDKLPEIYEEFKSEDFKEDNNNG